MAKQEVTAVQVQMAAAAGVKLLAVDDLPVPLSVAKSGALGILEGMLQAIASGEVVLGPAPVAVPEKKAGSTPDADPPKGDQQPPKKDGNSDDKKPAASA